MSRERAQELWTRHLSGEPLGGAEKAELLAALEADAALREELLRDSETDGMLRSARAEGDSFVEAFADRVAAESDSSRFIRKVTGRIRRRPPQPSRPAWIPILIAAGILLALLFAATQPKPVPTAPVVREAVQFEREERDREIAAEAREWEAEQARAKARLEEIERARATAEREALARLEEERRQMLARFEKAKAEAKRLEDERSSPPPVAPAPATPREATTTAEAWATLEVEGEVLVAGRRARTGDALTPGDGVEVREGRAVVALADRTRLELEPGTRLREISERPAAAPGSRGKYVHLEQGTLTAQVTPQPAGRTMVFATAHARARVLGTELRLTAAKDATRVDVREGKVQVTRPGGGTALDLSAGRSAVVAPGRPLAARDLLLVKSFTLVDANDAPIAGFDPIPEGAVVTLDGRPLNVRANVLGAAASVRFALDGKDFHVEKTAPWTLAGNDPKTPGWRPSPGKVSVTATPYGADLESGWPLTLRFQLKR